MSPQWASPVPRRTRSLSCRCFPLLVHQRDAHFSHYHRRFIVDDLADTLPRHLYAMSLSTSESADTEPLSLPSRPAPRQAEWPHLESWSLDQADGRDTQSPVAKPSRSRRSPPILWRTGGQEAGETMARATRLQPGEITTLGPKETSRAQMGVDSNRSRTLSTQAHHAVPAPTS